MSEENKEERTEVWSKEWWDQKKKEWGIESEALDN